VVLLVAVLPDSSGFDLCGRLREGELGGRRDRDLLVIIVSARGDPVDRVHATRSTACMGSREDARTTS
jgi:DNA-binding response OmpR family regulator